MSYDTPISKGDQALIDRIFEIRVRNNMPWKRLIEIAMQAEPNLTKEVLADIEANDRNIAALTRALSR